MVELVSGCCDSPLRFHRWFHREGRRASCAMIVRGRRGRAGILDWFLPSLTRESATGSCISNRLDSFPRFFSFSLLRSRKVVEPILIRLRPVEKRVQRRKVRDRKVREFLYLPGILIYKYAPASRNPLLLQNFFPPPSLGRIFLTLRF